MTQEDQKMAIATACGWKFYGSIGTRLLMWPPIHGDVQAPPDFPSDLNAAMEAARYFFANVLDSDGWSRFGQNILNAHPSATLEEHDEGGYLGVDHYDLATLLVETSAATICECLLKAANPWTP